MNDRENFISRWSRRKRQAADEKAQLEKTSARQAVDPSSGEDPNLTSPKSAVASPPVPEFDVATLPPIESIEAGTDISAFLRDGVPSALRHAALRRAWSADPAIRDFIGLNENYWDVANPGGISGFGDLAPNTDVQRMVSDLFGENALQEAGSDPSAAPAAISRPASEGSATTMPNPNTDAGESDRTKIAASQNEPVRERPGQRAVRRHGSALPE